MPNEFAANIRIDVTASLTDLDRVIYIPTASLQSNSGGLPGLNVSLGQGDIDGEANELFAEVLTIAAGGNSDVDLKQFTNVLRQANRSLSAVKLFYATLIGDEETPLPDGVHRFVVGPLGVANGAALWFAGSGADAGEAVWDAVARVNRWAGWPVSPTSKILRFHNPSANPIQVAVVIAGVA
ncbi:hypothetical protein [Tuwongella immobilis]|uniref:Uncharacterized protein n=1 Tax=Tuwongella immobilis TaxID=692036 RepID=A0A6C2YNX2_9BACT|nr:hypothetical protein [Tuwongella immobilis]VIP03067.1 unnamed protein product [Tuwongella immobilis]VTS03288.1 unnamed protein product [Tuwongella immobilis]